MIKRFLSIILLATGLQASWGFALLGPSGNGGDAWQTPVIGYDLAYAESFLPGGPVFLGDIGAPKNIGEEYRRNTPVVYYAYNASFLGFFGSNGVAAADSAYALMNTLTNVSSYSSDLSEFPLSSTHYNYQAQSLYLTDVKSVTLHVLVETLGLADPERFSWTLAERYLPPGGTCPRDEFYLVLQRNFDISPTSVNQIQYSSYVNDVFYSYYIVENCNGPNPLAFTVPFSVDPLAEEYTSVAANNFDITGGVQFSTGGGLQIGGYYTGLTRDDVAGFRYLMAASNINTENAAAGSLLQITNLSPQQVITTLSLGLFLSLAQTNDPATMQALYPGLIISATATNYLFFNSTNVTAYYTNQSVLPVFSNTVTGGLPNPTSLTNIYFFTNQPGPTVINYDFTVPFTTISTLDLATFVDLARTNNPATMLALYPGLQILRATTSPAFIPVTNYVSYLTNLVGSPYHGTPTLVTVPVSTDYAWITNWNYTFGNVFTNHFSTNRYITVQSIWITNLIGAPYGSPFVAITNFMTYKTNLISGDFFLIPTNWCGFDLTLAFPLGNPPYKYGPTNTVIYSGYSTNGATGTNNVAGGNAYGLTQKTYDLYTNYNYAVYPGICQPTLAFVTNAVPTVATNYQDVFANIQTISSNSTTSVTVITTNIGPCPDGNATMLCTNVTEQSLVVNTPSGDFFIVPAAWNCGYSIISTQSINQVGVTNTVITPVPPSVANIGQQYSVTTISVYTNRLLVIQPIICLLTSNGPALREGVERIQFVRANFDSLVGQFFQPITNTYSMVKVVNSQATNEYYQRIITRPDILMSADNQIAGNTFNGSITRNINFDQANILPGLAGPGVINSPVTFSYNKIGLALENLSMNYIGNTNQFLSQFVSTPTLAWASFDSSTNDPVVYPNGNSIQNLENQILVQISPTILANGTNNSAYPPVTFTATGGSFIAPFTWSAAGLPTGMTVSAGGTLSGTPTQTGTFDFTLQLTDSLARSVQWFYTLTIQ